MAKRQKPASRERQAEPLVNWHEPERNAHILDWRGRAHEFGLVPVDEHGAVERPPLDAPRRMLEDEEPEAFEDQTAELGRQQPLSAEEMDEPPASRVPNDELDLVRVYLQHIGKHKLLKAAEEQAIGRSIELARGDLLAALITIPAARQTLLSLADDVRADRAPAAELILLPDGGELKPGNVEPVLDALARLRRIERQLLAARRRAALRELALSASPHSAARIGRTNLLRAPRGARGFTVSVASELSPCGCRCEVPTCLLRPRRAHCRSS